MGILVSITTQKFILGGEEKRQLAVQINMLVLINSANKNKNVGTNFHIETCLECTWASFAESILFNCSYKISLDPDKIHYT